MLPLQVSRIFLTVIQLENILILAIDARFTTTKILKSICEKKLYFGFDWILKKYLRRPRKDFFPCSWHKTYESFIRYSREAFYLWFWWKTFTIPLVYFRESVFFQDLQTYLKIFREVNYPRKEIFSRVVKKHLPTGINTTEYLREYTFSLSSCMTHKDIWVYPIVIRPIDFIISLAI